MSEVESFLSKEDEAEIVQAILQAEKDTSGEIRVHLEHSFKGDHMKRAQELFYRLKMDNTRESNGVLLYIAVHDHRFAIIGDSGIHKRVPENFWDKTRDLIGEHFKKGAFKEGIVAGVLSAGEELKKHFPWKPGDTNELSNEVSRN